MAGSEVVKLITKAAKTLRQEPKGSDPTALSLKEFDTFGDQVTDPLALAAHTARGAEIFPTQPGTFFKMSEDQFIDATTALDTFNKNQVADVSKLSKAPLFYKVATGDQAGILRIQEIIVDSIGRGKIKEFMKGSEMTFKRPLYVMRNDGAFSGVKTTDTEDPKSIFSFKVVDPTDPNTFKGYGTEDKGDHPLIFKLPAGTKGYHPAGRADPHEIVVAKGEFDKSVDVATRKHYLESLKKGTALFGAAGVATVSGSEEADANPISTAVAKAMPKLRKLSEGRSYYGEDQIFRDEALGDLPPSVVDALWEATDRIDQTLSSDSPIEDAIVDYTEQFFKALEDVVSNTPQVPPKGVNTTAYTQAEYNTLGQQITDPLALAAHALRGDVAYLSDPSAKGLSKAEILKYAKPIQDFARSFEQGVPVPAEVRAKVEAIQDEIVGALSSDQISEAMAASKMKLRKHLYIMRTEGDGEDYGPHILHSATVVDPNRLSEFYEFRAGKPRIYLLKPGTEFYHPAGQAGPSEIVLTRQELKRAEGIATLAQYKDALSKGTALFSAFSAFTLLQSEEADATEGGPSMEPSTQDTSELVGKVQGLLDGGTRGGLIYQSLSQSGKYNPAQVSEVMLQALQPKIQKLRSQGVATADIMSAFEAAGIPLVSSGPQTQEPPLDSFALPRADATQPGIEAPTEQPPQQTPEETRRAQFAPPEGVAGFGKEQPSAPDIALDDGRQLSDVISQVKNVTMTYGDIGNELIGATGLSPQTAAKVTQAKADAQTVLTSELQKAGVKVDSINEYGEVMVRDEKTGELVAYDETMVDSLMTSAYEFGGAVMGAKAGFEVAPPHPIAKAAGAVLGGAAGAAFGRGTDVYRNALDLSYKVSMTELLAKMNDAAVGDITMGALGTSVGAFLKGTGKVSKQMGQGLHRAWDLFITGNKAGAQQTLMDVLNLNEANAIHLVTSWEKITGNKVLSETARQTGRLGINDSGALLRVVSETLPGAENVVARAAEESKTGGSKLSAAIDTRAKDISAEAANLTNGNIDVVLQAKLGGYVTSTKDFFDQTKSIGSELMADSPYRFNFKNATLIPAMKDRVKSIHNSALRKDFYHYLDRIKELGSVEGQVNQLRSFDNLLELRKTINELRSDARFKSFANTSQLKGSLTAIDKEIRKAATEHMPNGAAWVKQWKAANTEYHKMKGLEKNVLYKTLTNPRVSSDTAVRAITKSMTYTDPSTFMQVMGKLPPATRKNVEGAVLKHLVDKHTVGFEGGKQALNLPRLSEELEKVAMTQLQTRAMKRTIAEFAEVFKNDPHLLSATGNVPLPKFQSYLTADPVIRAKFEIASTLFNAVKSRMPFSVNAGRAALVKNLGEILDNPLDAKTSREILKALPNDPELKTALHQLAVTFTEQGVKENYGKVPIYRVHKPGEFKKASSTQLGRGMLYYTDKATAESIAKQTGAKVKEVMQQHKRIATPEEVAKVLGHEPSKAELKSPEVLQQLQDQDWAGIAVGNKVLLFKPGSN